MRPQVKWSKGHQGYSMAYGGMIEYQQMHAFQHNIPMHLSCLGVHLNIGDAALKVWELVTGTFTTTIIGHIVIIRDDNYLSSSSSSSSVSSYEGWGLLYSGTLYSSTKEFDRRTVLSIIILASICTTMEGNEQWYKGQPSHSTKLSSSLRAQRHS